MIRRFVISDDNKPQVLRVSEEISETSGSFFIETGYRVSWGITQNASVGQLATDDKIGPIFFSPNTPVSNLTYNVGTISSDPGAVFVSNSIEIYFNGLLLTKDVDYTEDSGNEEFTLIVGGDGLNVNPGSSDELSLSYVKNVSFTSPGSSTTISFRVPSIGTGFYIDYTNVSGSLLVVDVIYR